MQPKYRQKKRGAPVIPRATCHGNGDAAHFQQCLSKMLAMAEELQPDSRIHEYGRTFNSGVLQIITQMRVDWSSASQPDPLESERLSPECSSTRLFQHCMFCVIWCLLSSVCIIILF